MYKIFCNKAQSSKQKRYKSGKSTWKNGFCLDIVQKGEGGVVQPKSNCFKVVFGLALFASKTGL